MLETSPIILFFYSPKWAYNSFKVAYFSCIIPRFCIPQVQNRPQNIETELYTCPEIISHNGPQGYFQACSPLYCLLLYCTLYNSVHVLKLTLQSSLFFPFKWENVPNIPA